jgi:hypothetical protein
MAMNRSVLAALAVLPLLTACGIDVNHSEVDRKTDVEIKTPVGHVSVKTNLDRPDTGLPVRPGARPLRGAFDDADNASVKVGSPWFGVNVAAAKYEHYDAPEAIAAYYRDEMSVYGPVTECRGRIDSHGKRWACRENSASGEIHLLTTTGETRRVVVVKPRGQGSEFAIVRVEAHGRRAEASTP